MITAHMPHNPHHTAKTARAIATAGAAPGRDAARPILFGGATNCAPKLQRTRTYTTPSATDLAGLAWGRGELRTQASTHPHLHDPVSHRLGFV
ncbi:hypothetical protein GCM10010372_60790 [Streptomyces tauricus]|nr:hypothetical protein GCM10010372_60790 [Streptomyces tauricus]